MKTNWKKYFGSGLILGASALILGACGGTADTSDTGSAENTSGEVVVEGDVKLWVDTDHVEVFKGIVAEFEKEFPEVTVEVAAGSSADAKKDVSKDPKAAADVFMMPHDQVGQMAEAGLLYPNTKYADEVKANNVESAVEGVTWNDELYGYPYGVESQVLYYNKAKLTEDDVKSWTTLSEKGKIGTNFAEAGANYIFGPLFMSNGLYLYGETGEDPSGTNFNDEKGAEVLAWIAAQKNNPGVIQSGAEALANLEAGVSDAFLSGPWSKNDVTKALGENMGVAAYPTVDFGSGEVQMKAFLGVKLFAVNQQTDAPLASMALANYLSNETSQLIEFQEMGVIPSNKVVQANQRKCKKTLLQKRSWKCPNPLIQSSCLKFRKSFRSGQQWMPSSMMHTKATSPQTNTWRKLDKLVEDTSKVTEPEEEKE